MRFRTLSEAPIKKGTRVIVRADLDVPVRAGKIVDPFRIRENLSTIKFILRKGGRLRIITKIGRPGGKFVAALSVRPIARCLEKILHRKVLVVRDPFSDQAWKSYDHREEILLFENIRFWPDEERGDVKFALALARWGDIYINEAFAMLHRSDASVVALAKILPSYAGFHLGIELSQLEKILKKPKHPFMVVIGGVKLETKLPLVRRFLREADAVFVVGALANTMLSLRGREIGKSVADKFHDKDVLRSKKLHLPLDVVVVRDIRQGVLPQKVVPADGVKEDEYIVDAGPRSIALLIAAAKRARTVLWNGPLGLTPYFPKGTMHFAKVLAGVKAFRVVGGGDTAEALKKYGLVQRFDHISTGGGAMLEFLAGKKLPGLAILKKR